MSSKTFEGVDGTRLLHIKNLGKHVTMSIEVPGQVHMGITFDPASIPALALAELEAAGFEAQFSAPGTYVDGDHAQMENVGQTIKDYLSIKDAETAEVKEQAELEAEALELFNTLQTEIHGNLGPNWIPVTEFPSGETKRKWLAVGRKAREMRAEK
ncbi:hypothetical protein [Glutamicibacter ardleyensis]|uniref:hypothetical protein n=1 Tax=Glutamicibacter ardleyensis TaxID=225894 RepID=UPI003FD2FED6